MYTLSMYIYTFIYLFRNECERWKAHATLVFMAPGVGILKIYTFL